MQSGEASRAVNNVCGNSRIKDLLLQTVPIVGSATLNIMWSLKKKREKVSWSFNVEYFRAKNCLLGASESFVAGESCQFAELWSASKGI